MSIDLSQHNDEIQQNLEYWNRKPILRRIYQDFHKEIAGQLSSRADGVTVEAGSGIGNIKEVIPNCIRTDLFENPWIDQVESVYNLSFESESVANLIMFDVLHHLQYPGTALAEIHRVLAPNGRLIIFDPCVSALGFLVYGPFHHEPIAFRDEITWTAPPDWDSASDSYYAAQGNAFRIFLGDEFREKLCDWSIVTRRRYAALSYAASGGYSKPQLYPDFAYPLMRTVDGVCDFLPWLFATRILVVLEKSNV